MRHATLISMTVTLVGLPAAAQVASSPEPSLPSAEINCNAVNATTFAPFFGGDDPSDPNNWTNGLPDANTFACFPDEAKRAPSSDGGGINGLVNPPSPSTFGACCLGSECLLTDWFECRGLGGYLLPGVVVCNASLCGTGACCLDDPACRDDDAGGGPMDEALCDLRGGVYVGGAVCDDRDPCQRHRIPEGFENVEVAPGTETFDRRWPRLNNCGEIVFNMRTDSSSGLSNRIFRYDNGAFGQAIESEIIDGLPDINDGGTWSGATDW